MKRLILPLILLLSIGMSSQEVSLLHFDGEISGNSKQNRAESTTPDESLKHLDGLSDKKLSQYVRKEGITERLIEKGDDYFNKMWYAEAARIYDIVLEKSEAKHTLELLSKAGDSHYYSGNMEKSYKWYNELYQLYTDDIPEETFFKYTQTLKGTGKYRRAAALTKLFRQKRDEPLNELENLKPITWKGASSVKIKNMEINSKYSDFSPMFHNGSEIVYASAKDSSFLTTRRYRWTNQPFLDLYVAKTKNEEGDLVGSRKFSKKINTKYHEASMAFSPDQKTIYFTRNNYGKRLKRGQNGINHLKIYRSRWIDGEWTEAEELPFNSDDFSTGHPTISPDGHKMYFVSDRPGGFGQTDIYVVNIMENGGFSEPENLGRSVNTSAKEMFPYITDNALYFSSNRPMSLGGLDVYKSDYSNGVFSVGINLGEPINSSRDDFSYIIDASGEKGYFASNRKGGKGDDDIYSFHYTLNLNAVSGSVQDAATGEMMDGAKVSLLDKDGQLLAETTTNDSGSYTFKNLDPLSEYGVKAQQEGYFDDLVPFRTKENVDIAVSQHLKKIEKIMAGEKVKKPFEPNAVHFAFDSYKIGPKAAEELDKLVAALKENQDLALKIESHTDAVGSNAYNKYLSDRRAKATRDYLVSQDIDPSRILSAIGYGEERLLNDCSDGKHCPPDMQRLNRRSEFILVSK
ncbi:OmpA family protein [Flagellimonas aequoris]|uniref:Cell envelope biogenesis protein OmpA n=1 Tax=Flagellimonas aequoris TaxID=2306997 RepID=A0A418NAB8_9FLAO|nr:OmpA family protein [Allomuricauda aequoris]RIV72584.1 cell envelope biogenesis protein OmpA [Allomuricauda aequoris]TXK05084.1 OmpA family protein [Allomuricauda aequoris]